MSQGAAVVVFRKIVRVFNHLEPLLSEPGLPLGSDYVKPQNHMHKLVRLHDIVGSVRPRRDNKTVQSSLSRIIS
jgi:hypothetical protein